MAHDLERIGLFKEMGYTTVGEPYTPKILDFKKFEGKAIAFPGSKTRSANSDGYFEEFKRVFDSEGALTSFCGLRRKWRNENKAKILGKPWCPSSGHKHRSGVGSLGGNFTERIDAFGTLKRAAPYVPQKKNILTNPGKKGTGYGYHDVCLNKYPEYIMGNGYNDAKSIYERNNAEHLAKLNGRNPFLPPNGYGGYFWENPFEGDSALCRLPVPPPPIDKPFIPSSYPKSDGGCKDGTIGKFPEYSSEPYIDKQLYLLKDHLNDQGKRLLPNNTFPTYFPTSSILAKNVTFRCNNTNIGDIHRVMNY